MIETWIFGFGTGIPPLPCFFLRTFFPHPDCRKLFRLLATSKLLFSVFPHDVFSITLGGCSSSHKRLLEILFVRSTCEHQEKILLSPNIARSSQDFSAIAAEVSWQHYIHLQMAEVFKAKPCAGGEHTRNGKTPNRRKKGGNDPVPVPLPSIPFTKIHETGFTARILYSLPP